MTPTTRQEAQRHDMAEFEAAAARMQALVDAILGRLTGAGIPWCLLRNRDLVPWGLLQWSDLDIIVPASISRERLVALLADLYPTSIVPFRHGVTYTFFPIDGMFLRVDFFHGDTGWLGAPYSDNEEILAGRWNDRGIMVASPLHQAYLTWCNRLVRGGDLPERYQRLIRDQVREHPLAFRALLERHIGPDLASVLIQLAEEDRLDETPHYAWQFKRALWLTIFMQHPFRTLGTTANHLRDGWGRRLHPPGMDIVVLGSDPTAASALCTAFANSPYRSVPGVRSDYRRRLPHGEGRPRFDWLVRELGRAWFDRLVGDRGRRARMTFIFRDWHFRASAGHNVLAQWMATLAPQPDLVLLLERPGRISGPERPADAFNTHDQERVAKLGNVHRVSISDSPRATMDLAVDRIRAEISAAKGTPERT